MPDNDALMYDKRTAERYVRLGLLDEKVWEKHLKALPDAAEKAAPVESSLIDDDLEGDKD